MTSGRESENGENRSEQNTSSAKWTIDGVNIDGDTSWESEKSRQK